MPVCVGASTVSRGNDAHSTPHHYVHLYECSSPLRVTVIHPTSQGPAGAAPMVRSGRCPRPFRLRSGTGQAQVGDPCPQACKTFAVRPAGGFACARSRCSPGTCAPGASRSIVLLSVLLVQPFGPCRHLPRLVLTSERASRRLSAPVAPFGHTLRAPRVLRTHLHARACRIYDAPCRAGTGL